MKKILGLDIGTNSIGWALIDSENGFLNKIVDIGCRIIPEQDEHRDFEKGNDISKNAQRRQKRGSRRLNQRYKQRRNNIIKLCKILNIIPSGLEPLFLKTEYSGNAVILPVNAFNKGDFQHKPQELYELRNRALTEKISLQDLFRIIYHFNQRRGFKSNRKTNKEENSRDDIVDDKNNLTEISFEKVRIISVIPTGEKKGKRGKEELLISLKDGRIAVSDKFQFKNFVDKEIILEIKKEFIKSKNDFKFTFSFPSNWQKSRKELNDLIIKNGGYPGKYFFGEFLKAQQENKLFNFKVRENIVNRELYENEFQAVWNKQKELWRYENVDIDFLPGFSGCVERIIPCNNKEQKQLFMSKGLGAFLKNYIIYFQRDLKSQVKSIGDCQFEEKYLEITDLKTGELKLIRNGPKCSPKSHPVFQEFRIWQQIHNLKCFNEKIEEIPISDDVKIKLFEYLNERESAKKEDVDKLLKKILVGFDYSNISEHSTWVGNKTRHFFKKLFKKFDYDGENIFNDSDKYFRLWHLIYSVSDEKGIKTGLKRIDVNMPEELITALTKSIFSEEQYASLSLKALNNILPLMRCGKLFRQENVSKFAESRIKSFLNDDSDSDFDAKTLETLKKKKLYTEFYGLSYYESASLIYGKHSAKQLDLYSSPDEMISIKQNSLRNPVVEQIVNETLMLVKDIWKTYPDLKDGEIKIELARELKSNKEERKEMSRLQYENYQTNEKIIEEIKRHFGDSHNPSLSDIEKVKLWNEARKQSVYTGKTLDISEVLSASTEIDHIIPRSRFYNDGLVNKVVCESSINADKGNMTAYEYMNTGTKLKKLNYNEFLSLIKYLPRGKKNLLTLKEIPDDFIQRQLKETQYITKKVKEELGKIVGNLNVGTTTGRITDYLKDQWGLSELMRNLIAPRFEKLQEQFGINLIKKVDVLNRENKPSGKKRTIIKGFSKRYDHRHHALDALIVSCTRQGIIQQLNLLNQINNNRIKPKEDMFNGSPRKFIPPTGKEDKGASIFYSLAEDAANSIIVSYKNKKRLLAKGNNWYQIFDSASNKIIKVKQTESSTIKKNWSIKGQLHKETNYGLIKYNGALRHSSRCSLSSLTSNKISNIADYTLKNQVLTHINKSEYSGDLKKAFSPEGLMEFNSKRIIPVYSVRVIEDGLIDKVKGKTPLYDFDRKLFVEKGGNYCVAFYEHPETKLRKFDVVSFFDAVHLKVNGENPYQTEMGHGYINEGYRLIFTLSHNDLVYIPQNAVLDSIDWKSKKLFPQIYRIVKFSDNRLYFQPHYFAKEITIHHGVAKTASDYKGEFSKGTNGTEKVFNSDVSIKDICIKLDIDRLGNIKPFYQL